MKVDAMQALVGKMKEIAELSNKDQIQTNPKLDDFKNLLLQQIKKVNDSQQEAASLQEKFITGDRSVTLPQVMVATEKSNIYSQFLIHARDKALTAYNEIMNMSV